MIRTGRAGIVVLLLFLAASGSGCGPDSDAAAAGGPASGSASNRSGLKLEAEMAKGISVEEVLQVSLPVTLKAFGKVQFNEDRIAMVLAPLPGQVAHLAVKVGDEVRQGDVL